MVNILTQNDISQALISFFKVALPNLTTTPGSVASDLFIDAPSSQLALLYTQLSQISNLQSLRTVSGSDLDKLAQNFGAVRNQPTPASGTALFTFSSIPAAVAINAGNIVTAYTGATFSVVNGITVDPTQLNTYRATAIKYQNNLSFLNITDQYAVEVSVQATTSGSAGNISAYTINATTIAGVSNITNVFPFTGGSDQETDAAFRNRVLAIFSGANVGTALGYQNAALAVQGVLSAVIIGPGNPLMTRDGTISVLNANGTYAIISDGTGGKVDIQILGLVESGHTDSFIYTDKSNTNDPTNAKNNFILGQIPGEGNLTIPERRVQDVANDNLPAQPVQSVVQVSGSQSGSNFIPMTTDAYGRVSGNYEVIKDTGVYQGSAWAQDAFHWTSDQINYTEQKIKSLFNGQDATAFSGVLNIPQVQQNIPITNENSNVSASDNSMITVLHTPSTNVTRVFNTNTGERYTIINQNVDGTGSNNTTGVIQISGNTLPSLTDILQVDYTWITSYDPYSDYDGKLINDNPNNSGNSVDWSIANAIRNERATFVLNSTNTLYTANVKHSVSYVISADTFSSTNGNVIRSTVPNFLTRAAIVISNLSSPINSITSIKLTNTEVELWTTAADDGFIINTEVVIGVQFLYNATIILPTDTYAEVGNNATIEYNDNNVFSLGSSTGNFLANQITIPVANITGTPSQINLDTTYITSVQNVLMTGITSFPLSRSGNGFYSNTNTGETNTITSNTLKVENQTIQKNGSSQLFINLSITSSAFTMDGYDVVSVIDLASGNEIWNADYMGTLTTATSGNYQLIFSGYNAPVVGDNVLVLYFADDSQNTQPFTFYNRIFSKTFETVQTNSSGNFFIPIAGFTVATGLSFDVIDTTTGLPITSGSDGYIFSPSSNTLEASFSSLTDNFSTINDLTGKLLQIHEAGSNTGSYNIFAFNPLTDTMTIGLELGNLEATEISAIRIRDGKDLWTAAGIINVANNTLTFAPGTLALAGDEVVLLLFTNKVLHQAPTKLAITVSDQNQNTGKIVVEGTTQTQVAAVLFQAIENGLQQDLTVAILAAINAGSNAQIPSGISVSRIVSLEQVSITAGNIVLSTLATYDIQGIQLANPVLYANEAIPNPALSSTEFILPPTANNIANTPSIGDQMLITFYYETVGATESVYFTRNGTLYTNNEFALLDQVYVASGFNTSQSAKFTFAYFTQPAAGSSYAATYNYLAPQPNERITINYNYNQLITTVQLAIEATRPITADVLVKAAQEVLVDVSMNIVVLPSYITAGSTSIVLQNVQSAIINAINTNMLGAVLNQSNLIVAAQAVAGVERSRILAFNVDGQAGQVLTLTAQQNQYFVANVITVNQETISSG